MIPKEQAEKEVNEWLDFKKVKQSRRETLKKEIDDLVQCVADGYFVIDPETKVIKFELGFPIKNDKGVETIKSLEFAPRVIASKVQDAMLNVPSGDTVGFINAYICALVDQPKNVVRNLDQDDHNIAKKVAVFFM